jgi:hypothetical protein
MNVKERVIELQSHFYCKPETGEKFERTRGELGSIDESGRSYNNKKVGI